MSFMLFDNKKYYFENEGKHRFTDDWRSWCRICAKPDANQYIDVVSGQCVPTVPSANCHTINLVSELEELFRIHINDDDKLPSWICRECFLVVKYFHEFKEDTKRVQQLYHELLNSADQTNIKKQFLAIQNRAKQSVEEAVNTDNTALSEFLATNFLIDKVVTQKTFENVELNEMKNDPIKTDSRLMQTETYNSNINEDNDAQSTTFADAAPFDFTDSEDSKDSTNENQYTCDLCLQSYQRKSNYTSHMIKKHNYVKSPERQVEDDTELYPCPQCDQKFRAKGNIPQHLLLVHKDDKPFICEACGAKESTRQLLQEHMAIHKDYLPFECEVCGKCFRKKKYLKSHMYIHGDKLMCPKCGKRLSCPTTYRNHMLVHSDKRRHKCDYCEREFKRANSLKAHLILHTGMTPYSCEFCDKTYGSKSTSTMHMKKKHPKELEALEAAGGRGFTYVPKVDELKSLIQRTNNPVKLRSGRKAQSKLEVSAAAKPAEK